MPAPTTQFFTGRMPFLPPNQQHQSTERNVIPMGTSKVNSSRSLLCNYSVKTRQSSVIGRTRVVKHKYPYFCNRNRELMQIACRPPTQSKALEHLEQLE